MRWLGVKSQGSIPTSFELLRLVYVGRMCLGVAIYVTAALKVRVAAPIDILVSSLMLVTAAAVEGMKPGSVVVDLAGETGGNCELTEPGSEIVRNGVSILGPLNLASTLPRDASQMYAKNVAAFLGHVVQDGKLRLDFEDQITRDTCVTHAGEVRKS